MSELRALLRQGDQDRLAAWIGAQLPRDDPDRYAIALVAERIVTLPAGDGRRYCFGCLQDLMLAVFAVVLESRGVLSLQDRVSDHCPSGLFADDTRAPTRIVHLLTRTSGLWVPEAAASLRTPAPPDRFREFVGSAIRRFEPGAVAAHSLLERVLLVRVLGSILGADPYLALRKFFWPKTSSVEMRPAQGLFENCYQDIWGTVADLASFAQAALSGPWFARLTSSELTWLAAPTRPIKDWAPKAVGLGAYRMDNGLWGQDGDDPQTGHIAIRIDAVTRTAVAGRFATTVERDFMLAVICSDLAGLRRPTRDYRLGTLAGFSPEELVGDYEGMFGHRLSIGYEQPRLHVRSPSLGEGALPLDIRSDGLLTARWAGQTLWLEPARLAGEQGIALHFGRHLYVKTPIEKGGA